MAIGAVYGAVALGVGFTLLGLVVADLGYALLGLITPPSPRKKFGLHRVSSFAPFVPRPASPRSPAERFLVLFDWPKKSHLVIPGSWLSDAMPSLNIRFIWNNKVTPF